MKKFICLFAIFAILISSVTIGSVSAAVSAEECDRLFAESMDGFLADQGISEAQFTAEKDLLYDINLETLGYLYTYEVNGKSGYTVIINNQGIYEVTESYFDAVNPYAECEGLYVYVLPFVYWEYDGEQFVDLASGATMTDELVEAFLEQAYLGAGEITNTSETVYYTQRNDNKYDLALSCPQYTNYTNRPSPCAAIAGTNIVGFYDRYYDNLIPDFTAGIDYGSGIYIYNFENAKVGAVLDILYDAMDTDPNAGATVAGFRSGLSSYVASKGRSITYYSLMSGGSFNYSSLKSRIDSGMPAVVFLQTYHVSLISTGSDRDVIQMMKSNGNHVMAGFGYREITYTLTSGSQRIDRYISVSSGQPGRPVGYLNIASNVNFDDAYAIKIN